MESLRQAFFEALLTDIERMQVAEKASLDEVKELLIASACCTVTEEEEDRFTAWVVSKVRQEFIAYIENISPTELARVTPLPFRRVLCGEEAVEIWRRLDERWYISGAGKGFWFPLNTSEREIPGRVIAFLLEDFLTGHGVERLWQTLMSHAIAHVWELFNIWPPQSVEYEMDVSLVDPRCSKWERYWTAVPMDWLIYASHEGTITFAGDWLVEAILSGWPGWRESWHQPREEK